MKTLPLLLTLCFLLTSPLRAEEFFATASEAITYGEIALKQNQIDPDKLILFKMEIRPAHDIKNGWTEGWKPVYEAMDGRDAWTLYYKPKEGFDTTMLYGQSHIVLLFSKTEAVIAATEIPEEN